MQVQQHFVTPARFPCSRQLIFREEGFLLCDQRKSKQGVITMPQEELVWGVNANCYAYAFNCPNPIGNAAAGAVPGGATGNPVLPGPGPLPAYLAQLIAGVIADGAGQVIQVVAPIANPPGTPASTYLAALIYNAGGFHCLRRDSYTQRWSWKDGNAQTVKLNIMSVPNQQWVYINDQHPQYNLNDLLTNHQQYAPWNYGGMFFGGFFQVPDAGIIVGR